MTCFAALARLGEDARCECAEFELFVFFVFAFLDFFVDFLTDGDSQELDFECCRLILFIRSTCLSIELLVTLMDFCILPFFFFDDLGVAVVFFFVLAVAVFGFFTFDRAICDFLFLLDDEDLSEETEFFFFL